MLKNSFPLFRFINGEVFVAEGKNLRPARVEKRPFVVSSPDPEER
jgi:hypothetical protein